MKFCGEGISGSLVSFSAGRSALRSKGAVRARQGPGLNIPWRFSNGRNGHGVNGPACRSADRAAILDQREAPQNRPLSNFRYFTALWTCKAIGTVLWDSALDEQTSPLTISS